MNLGIAFQLVDDALDYAADQATLGKTVGDDFREGKITLPVLAAYARRRRDRARLLAPHDRGQRPDRGRSRPRAAADGRARRDRRHAATAPPSFAAPAKASLQAFAESPLRRSLLAVADYTVSRAR